MMARTVAATLLIGVLLAAGGAVRAQPPGREAFDELKQLVGTWRPADKPDSALRVVFALTAGDSVLTESWSAPDHSSMTVYHLDGETLLATHYCPRANQPRLALQRRQEDGTLRFEFRDATGLDEPGEYYEYLLTLRRDDAGRLVRGEVYAEHGPPPVELPEPELTRFERFAEASRAPR
jgi:hypothetical protein